MPIVDELVTLLSFKSDTSDADKTKKAMTDVKSAVKGVAVALVGATAAAALFVRKSLSAVDTNARFAESIGMSYEKLQELEYAAVSVGGSTDELKGDLEALTQSMSSPIPGEFNNELAMLGINTRKSSGELKSSGEVLGDLSKKFEGMSTMQSFQWGKKLGLSKTTIDLLRKGEDGLKALQQEAHSMGAIVPSENLDAVRKTEESIAQLKKTVMSLMQSVAAGLAPELKTILGQTKKWVATNKDMIKTGVKEFIQGLILGFQKFKGILIAIWTPVKSFLDLLSPMVGEMDRVKVISNIVAGVLTAVLASGVVAVVGKIISFISVIKSFLGIMKTVTIFLATNPLGILLVAVGGLIALFIQLKSKTGSVKEALAVMGRGILKTVLLPINLLIKAIVKLFELASNIPGKVGKGFSDAAKKIKAFQDEANMVVTGSASIDPTKEAREVLGRSHSPQEEATARYGHLMNRSAPAASSGGGKGNVTIQNDIKVSGAGSPAAVAREVAGMSASEVLQVQSPGTNGPTIG